MNPRLLAATLLLAGAPAHAYTPAFTEITGTANPFNGIALGNDSTTYFVDIDGDGDKDFFAGEKAGIINFFRNTGSASVAVFTPITGSGNPLNAVNTGSNTYTSPVFVNVDGDTDPDCFIGLGDGTILYYRNIGTALTPLFSQQTGISNPFNGIDVGSDATLDFADLDNDGDKDAMVGKSDGKFLYYRNTGTALTPVFTLQSGAANPLDGVDIGSQASPAFGDFDGDGDIDIMVGLSSGKFRYYMNIGSAGSPSYVEQAGVLNPMNDFDVGGNSAPAIVDIDNDGDQDIFSGNKKGNVRFYRHTPLSSMLGDFNAIEVGDSALTGVIKTKIAGTNFNLDIVAINDARTGINTAYNDGVKLSLLDASDDSGAFNQFGCRTSWFVVATQGSLTFAQNDSGRKTKTGFNYANALRKARVLVQRDTNNVDKAGCSTDAFAIRPANFLIAATDATVTTAGTARTLNATTATGTPIHHAGTPFTVTVTARNSSNAITTGYDGNPALTAVGSVLGTTFGTVAQGGWTYASGVGTNNNVTYSEAGAFTLQTQDTTYASIDATDGSTTAERYVPAVTASVGRFTPANFSISYNTPRFMPACTTAFSYIGQPFAYSVAPSMTVTAINAAGGTTANYTGTLFKLSTGSVTRTGNGYSINSGSVDASALVQSVAMTNNNNATATFTLDTSTSSRLAVTRGTAVAPYDAEISLQGSLTDSDGVTFSGNPFAFGAITAGSGIAFAASGNTGKQMRFGRLVLQNNYGSELLPLGIPLRVEYFTNFSTGSGFTLSSDDTCTTGSLMVSGHVTLNKTALANPASVIAVTLPSISAGSGSFTLGKPNPVTTGRAVLTLNLLPSYSWLQVDTNNDGSYLENPSAIGAFGLYGGDPRQVYSREYVR